MNPNKERSLTIKDWDLTDRPREKLLQKGVSALSNAELLAIIIGSGRPGLSAVDLMKNLLSTSEHRLQQLNQKSIAEFTKFDGIGTAKAVKIKAALGLASRFSTEGILDRPAIQSSAMAFQFFRDDLSALDHEQFWVLYLNQAHRSVGKLQLSKGGIAETVVDLRLLFKRALELNATAIIMAHNHPSGNLTPSASDRNLTQRVRKAAGFFDIKLLDHLILSGKKYFSFADKQLL
ncbi:MAG: DNA repair protein RadC [Flavobacteriales bacterium]|jgi:DNA repair protein RadC|nr:DNA repair protein RadC [Flavobacteriales bacterium]